VGLLHALQDNQNYSAGQLVPLVAIFFVWRQRKCLKQSQCIPCWWGGIALLLLAEAVRIYGVVSLRFSLERYALVLALAGAIVTVAGLQVFRRVFWILLFLLLMVPLPGRVHNMISPPLQRLATTGSVFLLEAFGMRVSQQGNVVMLGDNTPMAVAEACSGLRMLTAFIIVAAFIAYMVKRPRWHKAVLLASSIPVAVACNIIRIFLTAMIMLYVSVELGEHFFHDFAGLVMMPAAVSLIFGQIWLLDRIVTPEEQESPSPSDVKSKSGGQPAVIHARRVAK
jgi:exosortase